MPLNLNIEPYFDDFDANKNYHKILFVPGRPLQARELTQIQSLLQHQVKLNADYMFKNGAMVIPGNIGITQNASYLKLAASLEGILTDSVISHFAGAKIEGETTGVKATVVHTEASTATEPPVLFVNYTSGNIIGTTQYKSFIKNETLNLVESSVTRQVTYASYNSVNDEITFTSANHGLSIDNKVVISGIMPSDYNGTYVITSIDQDSFIVSTSKTPSTYISGGDCNLVLYSVKTVNDASYTGKGSLASIVEGVYYINGYFVQNTTQTISLDKFSAKPTYRIGLEFTENIVTSFDDNTLNDNAIGSSNYGAPGADRYQIVLKLAKRELFTEQLNVNTTDEKFIDLMHVRNGEIQFKVDKTELGEFEKTLARRTYDESGNYIVDPFKIDIFEYRNNNRGQWAADTIYVTNDVVYYTVGTKKQYFTALSTGVSGSTVPNVTYGEHDDGNVIWLATNNPKFNNGFFVNESTDTLDDHVSQSLLGMYKISGGKAYIKGYEISPPGYKVIEFDKARAYKNVAGMVVKNTAGQYTMIDNVKGIPSISYIDATNKAYPLLNIKDAAGTTTGTCRIRNIEYSSGTIGQTSCIYRAYIFDINMNSGKLFAKDCKQIATSANGSFSAKINGKRTLLSGSVKTSGSSTTLNGDGTSFSVELSVGDTVVISDQTYRVTAITDSVSITIDRAVSIAAATPIYLQTTVLVGNEMTKQMPNAAIRSIRASDDSSLATSYSVRRVYQAQATAGVINLYLTAAGETFETIATGNYLVALADGSATTTTATFTTPTSTNLQIAGLSGTNTYRIFVTVRKTSSAAKEKQKIRHVKTVTLTTLNTSDLPKISLSEADCSKLISVTQSGGTQFNAANRTASVAYSTTNEIDITRNYKLNSGQTPWYYGLGSINPINNFKPSAPIRITYEYFEHTEGDYFSVNSYDVPYEFLPVNNSINVSDLLDFRPRIADTGADYDVTTGASITEPLAVGYDIVMDYSYYLPRRDILQLTPQGTFRVEQGTPSDTPIAPIPNDEAVVIATAALSPYTLTANSANVSLTMNKLRRYTMRDIGAIDDRLKNVEYYVAMTALEKQTKDMEVKDEFGLNRYKNGFIVDQFKDHGVGNISSPDYKIAVDQGALEARPTFFSDDIKLIERFPQSRVSNNYKISGDVVTLPFTHDVLVQQKTASSAEYITPYTHIRSMTGDLTVYPASDTWVDTETAPNVNQISEGNFNQIQAVAQSTGMLGTVWNSWQVTSRTTAATSAAYTTKSSSTRSTTTNNQSWWGWWARITTSQTTTTYRTDTTTTQQNMATTTNFQRTGTTTYVQEKLDEIGRVTNVVDEKWAPYMRARALVLYSKRMLPLVSLGVYIDKFNLTPFVEPASTLRMSNYVGTFSDYATSSIDQSLLNERRYGARSYDILDKGEIVKGQTSGATAVVICDELQKTSGVTETVLKVVNAKGTFKVGEVIKGLTSGATAIFVSLTAETGVRTNSAGSFYGILNVPNQSSFGSMGALWGAISAWGGALGTNAAYNWWNSNMSNPTMWNGIRIPAGIVTISVRDSIVAEDALTKSEANYDAHGIVQVKQTTIMSVRNGVIAKRTDTQTASTTENWTKTLASSSSTSVVSQVTRQVNCDCNCGDPLAQTFRHTTAGGIFLSKVDLYFHTVDQDPASGIVFQIREVINGYPGPAVIPFGQVTKYPHQIVASKTSLVPTSFEFVSPVYLEPNRDYCIVIGSELSNTKIWVSKIGEVGIDGSVITQQPHMGSFFRSQNNRTWDTDQLSDMCFTMYKAKFDITKYGHISFKNHETDPMHLQTHPFKITAGSTFVRVNHKNHGLTNGCKVTYAGAVTALTHPTTSELNTSFIVSNVELDSYTITLATAATDSGWYGGANVVGTSSRRMDTMFIRGTDFVIPQTHINYTFRSTKQDSATFTRSSTDLPVEIARNVYFNEPQFVLSTENELKFISGEESLRVDAYLYSDNPDLSPMIDLASVSVHTVSNKINDPSSALNLESDLNNLFTITALTQGTITFNNAGYFEITNSTSSGMRSYFDELSAVKVGKYVKFTGTASNNAAMLITKTEKLSDDTIYRIYTSSTVVNETITDPTTLTFGQYEYYIDFISPSGGSNLCNYVTRIVQLANQCTSFKLMFDYNRPADASIDIYYKTDLTSSYNNLEQMNWIKLTTATFDAQQNMDEFVEQSLDVSLPLFDQITVKVVFRSTNTAKVPRIKNFRLLALA